MHGCLNRLHQSREKKNNTIYYCARHKFHYYQECVYCAIEEGKIKGIL